MEEIKLWKIAGSNEVPIVELVGAAAKTKTEQFLEEILVKAPYLLFDGLKIVGRQVETPAGALDLLGIDDDGRIIVFELKRGQLTRDAVAQIFDYASYVSTLSPVELSELIVRGSGKLGVDKIADFDSWYEEQFGGKGVETIGKPKMVLVGLGADDRARRIVEFLANENIEISLMTFHGFDDHNGMYLAKHVEVAQRSSSQSPRASKQTNLQALARLIDKTGMKAFFDRASGLIRAELKNAYEWPNQTGYSYYLQDTTESGTPTNRGYVTISIPNNPKGSLRLALLDRAIDAAGETWVEVAGRLGDRFVEKKGYVELNVLSISDWNSLEPDLKKLCAAILSGRNAIQEHDALADREAVEEK